MFRLLDFLNFRFSLSLFLDKRLISESYHGLSSGLISTFFDGTLELTKSRKISLNLEHASSRVPCLRQVQSKLDNLCFNNVKFAFLYK